MTFCSITGTITTWNSQPASPATLCWLTWSHPLTLVILLKRTPVFLGAWISTANYFDLRYCQKIRDPVSGKDLPSGSSGRSFMTIVPQPLDALLFIHTFIAETGPKGQHGPSPLSVTLSSMCSFVTPGLIIRPSHPSRLTYLCTLYHQETSLMIPSSLLTPNRLSRHQVFPPPCRPDVQYRANRPSTRN